MQTLSFFLAALALALVQFDAVRANENPPTSPHLPGATTEKLGCDLPPQEFERKSEIENDTAHRLPLAVAKQQLDTSRTQFGPNSDEVANALDELAAAYRLKGVCWRLDAETAYSESSMIVERRHGLRSLKLLVPLLGLAEIQLERRRFDEANALVARVLDIPSVKDSDLTSHVDGPDSPTYADLLTRALGDYQRLQVERVAVDPALQCVEVVKDNIAHSPLSSDAVGDIEAVRRAIEDTAERFGPGSPQVAVRLIDLGSKYEAFGDCRARGAEPPFRRSLEIISHIKGATDPEALPALDGLGLIELRATNYAQAEMHYKLALAIRRKSGKTKPEALVASIENLASVYERSRDANRQATLASLLNEAIQLRERAAGQGSIDIVDDLDRLAECYDQAGQQLESVRATERSVSILHDAKEYRESARRLRLLASRYEKAGALSNAEVSLRRALAEDGRFRQTQPKNSSIGLDLSTDLRRLADIKRLQGMEAEAKELEERARAEQGL